MIILNCLECEYFQILYEPLKSGRDVWDMGKAVCKQNNLVCDFASHRTLMRLECVAEKQADDTGTDGELRIDQ